MSDMEVTPILWPTTVTGTVDDFDEKFARAVMDISMRNGFVQRIEWRSAENLGEGAIQCVIWDQGLPERVETE